MGRVEIVKRIGCLIRAIAPNAETIMYGSEARGESKENSDIDLLILVDKERISPQEEDRITAPIYDLEFESGVIVSPIVMTKKAWEKAKRQTMFYHNVMRDGVVI